MDIPVLIVKPTSTNATVTLVLIVALAKTALIHTSASASQAIMVAVVKPTSMIAHLIHALIAARVQIK